MGGDVDWVSASGIGSLGFFAGVLVGLFVASRPNLGEILFKVFAIIVTGASVVALSNLAFPAEIIRRENWFYPVGLSIGLVCGLFMYAGLRRRA
jgi:uncharacterized membrane protein